MLRAKVPIGSSFSNARFPVNLLCYKYHVLPRRIQQSSFLHSKASRLARSLKRSVHAWQKRHSALCMAEQITHPLSGVLDDNRDSNNGPEGPIVQYVVLRRDLYTDLKWPLGSVVAQACHAATAAMWENREETKTREYCSPSNLDSMHKVVLEVKSETQLRNLATKLLESNIRHKLWVEQPEDFPTCLASAPYPKSEVQQYFKKLKLCNF